jgi:hypothetical protein
MLNIDEEPPEMDEIDEGFDCVPAVSVEEAETKLKQFFQNPPAKPAIIESSSVKHKQCSMQSMEDQRNYLDNDLLRRQRITDLTEGEYPPLDPNEINPDFLIPAI